MIASTLRIQSIWFDAHVQHSLTQAERRGNVDEATAVKPSSLLTTWRKNKSTEASQSASAESPENSAQQHTSTKDKYPQQFCFRFVEEMSDLWIH